MSQTGTEIEALEDRATMIPCTWRDGQQVGEQQMYVSPEEQALFDSL